MKKILVSLLAVVGVFAVMAACSHKFGPEQRAEWMTSHLSNKLDLNADQKTKLDAIKETMLAYHKTHKEEQNQTLAEAKRIILGDKLDATQVKSIMSKRQKMMDDGFDQVFAKVAEFHASLTPEQKQKGVDMLDKFAKGWNE